MTTHLEPTEFERLLETLGGQGYDEIVGLVLTRVSQREASHFVALAAGLSLDALKFVAARTLLRRAARYCR